MAYLAQTGEKCVLVENGKEGKAYDGSDGDMFFSADSQHLATVFREGGKEFVVINGHEGPRFDWIITFTGGTIHFDSPNLVHYLGTKANDVLLVEEVL